MKKGFLKTFLISLLMSFVFIFSACNTGTNVYVDSYSITNEDESSTLYVGDNFTLDGYILNLVMTDGSKKSIKLQDSMIKNGPDMTSSGKKTVVLDYNSKTYSFNIYVEPKEKKEFLQELRHYLENFDSLINLPEEIVINAVLDYSASYLGNTAIFDSLNCDLTISPIDIVFGSYDSKGDYDTTTLLEFEEEDFAEFAYEALITTFIRKSFTPDNDDIVNVEEKIIRINLSELGTDTVREISGYDFIYSIVNDYILIQENSYYSDFITNFLAEIFYIDVVFDEGDDEFAVSEAKYDLQNFSTGIVLKVKSCEFKSLSIKDYMIDLGRIVYKHSSDSNTRILFTEVLKSAVGYDCSTDTIINENIDEKHIFSNVVSAISDLNVIYKENEDGSTEVDNSEEAREAAQEQTKKITALIRAFEDYIYDSFEAAKNEQPYDTKAALDKIKLASEDYVNFIYEMYEDGTWIENIIVVFITEPLIILNDIIDLYDANPRIFIVNIMKYFDVMGKIIDSSGLSENITDEQRELIITFLYDVLQPNPNYDYENYIRSLCSMVGYDDEELVQEYIREFEETKTFSLLSDFFTDALAFYKDEEYRNENLTSIAKELNITNVEAVEVLESRIEATESLIITIKYLENIPINGYDPLVLTNYITTTLQDISSGAIGQEHLEILIFAFSQLFDIEAAIRNNIQKAVGESQVLISEWLTGYITSLLNLDEDDSPVAYREIKTIISYAVSEYAKGSIDYTSIMNSFFKTVNEYCEDENKIIANSLGIMLMIIVGESSEISFDYNKMFEYIDLPNSVNSINYNELIEKLFSNATYADFIKVSDPQVKFVEEQGVLIAEVVTFNISVNFELVTITSFNASLECSFMIPLI